MKLFFFLAAVFVLTVSADSCKKKKEGVYKGRLEIKALCMNYTIKILEGDTDTSLVTANWTDESTGKAYTNVVALGSRCNFPDSIKQGDEFYFVIDTAAARQQCAVCMAFYPTPPKKMPIRVVEK
jgi:hypothetical protein